MKVLIVDTDAGFRRQLSQLLSRRGVQVQGADDMEQAREMACRQQVDAILLGAAEHERGMLAFLGDVRIACPQAQVVFINHSGTVSLSIEAMKLGAYAEMGAPVDMEELERKLRSILDHKKGAERG